MGNQKTTIRCTIVMGILGISAFVFLMINLMWGSISIPWSDTLAFLTGKEIDETFQRILWEIRFPRAMAAMILGSALALSGYLLQTFFYNPIASPFVLGISAGSKLVVALVMVCFMGTSFKVTSVTLIVAAFVGAMISMGFVLLMARKVDRMATLVISGVMIGYICSAITDFIATFAADADIVNLHNWSKGSFSGTTWENVYVMVITILITGVFVLLLSKPISAYQLGEAYAKNMGVNIKMLRVLLILCSSILSACVVAFAGPVSFVGIAVPHLTKKMSGTTIPFWMIILCSLGGSVVCLACDFLARIVFAPTELSISTVTAAFGAPVVLWIMTERKKGRG